MTLATLLRHETILARPASSLALIVLAPQSDHFFTVDNLLNQGRLMTEVGLIALDHDLRHRHRRHRSFGRLDPRPVARSCSACSGRISACRCRSRSCSPSSVGTFAGLRQRPHHHPLQVPPLIATLATLALYRGLAEGICQARSVRGYPDWFYVLGQGEVLGVPTQLWLLGIVARHRRHHPRPTPPGAAPPMPSAPTRSRRASPASRSTAPRSRSTRPPGFVAALAAVIFVSRVSTTRSDMGTGIELDAITAVVLGGTSIFGGRGTIIGTVLGLILIQALKNGLSLAGVKGDGTIVVIGAVLILARSLSQQPLPPGRQPMKGNCAPGLPAQ